MALGICSPFNSIRAASSAVSDFGAPSLSKSWDLNLLCLSINLCVSLEKTFCTEAAFWLVRFELEGFVFGRLDVVVA